MTKILDFNNTKKPSEPEHDTYRVRFLDIFFDPEISEDREGASEKDIQGFVSFGPTYVAISTDAQSADFIIPLNRMLSITKVTNGTQAETSPEESDQLH